MTGATFVGNPNALHVAQPEESELCFAACVSSKLGGISLAEIHQSLVDSFVSDDDGSTSAPMGSQEVTIAGRQLNIEPIYAYRDDLDTAGVIELIDEQLRESNEVVLLHKKTSDQDDPRYHWVLLTGYKMFGKDVADVKIMDPEAQLVKSIDPIEVVDMIDRSIKAGAVFAYSLVSGKEAV